MQSPQFQLHAAIEQRHWWFVARRQIIARLVHQILPPDAGATLIDVGCGTGANLELLARDYRCLGIDTSAEAIGLAKERFPHVEFCCGLAPQVRPEAFADAKLVLLMDVLEHVEDAAGLLRNLLAAIPVGAQLLLTVPADMRLWSEHDVSFGHYRRYDLASLRNLWDDLPVTTRLCSYFNSRLYPLVRAVRWWGQVRGRSAGEAGTDFHLPTPWLNASLQHLFVGEGRSLQRSLDRTNALPYRRGVSLVAVLRREAGTIDTDQTSRTAELGDLATV